MPLTVAANLEVTPYVSSLATGFAVIPVPQVASEGLVPPPLAVNEKLRVILLLL